MPSRRAQFIGPLLIALCIVAVCNGDAVAQDTELPCYGKELLELLGKDRSSPQVEKCVAGWGSMEVQREGDDFFSENYPDVKLQLIVRKAGRGVERSRVVAIDEARNGHGLRQALGLPNTGELAVRNDGAYGVAAGRLRHTLVFTLDDVAREVEIIQQAQLWGSTKPWVALRANEVEACKGEALLELIGQDEDSDLVSRCRALWVGEGPSPGRSFVNERFKNVGVGLLMTVPGKSAPENTRSKVIALFTPVYGPPQIPLPAGFGADTTSGPMLRDIDGRRYLTSGRGAIVYVPPTYGTNLYPKLPPQAANLRAERALISASSVRGLSDDFGQIVDGDVVEEPPVAKKVRSPEEVERERQKKLDRNASALWRSGQYAGQTDEDGIPHGLGQLRYKDRFYVGMWSEGFPVPGATFRTTNGELQSRGWDFFDLGPLDDSLRHHGNVRTWAVQLDRIKLGDIDKAINSPTGAYSEGEWVHGDPVGTHVVRPCPLCPVARTARFEDGVHVDGDYPWSIHLLAEVEDEYEVEVAAPNRARRDSLRRAYERKEAEAEARRAEARRQAEQEEERRRESLRRTNAQVEARYAEFRRQAVERGARIIAAYRFEPDVLAQFTFDAVNGRRDAIAVIGPQYASFTSLVTLGGDPEELFGDVIARASCQTANGLCLIDTGQWKVTADYAAYLTLTFDYIERPLVYLVHYTNDR